MRLSMIINLLTMHPRLFIAFDPLEQFDVLALPILGGGLTNLSLLLALNLLIMAA